MSQPLKLMQINALNEIPMRGSLISTERIKGGYRMMLAFDLAIRKTFLSRVQVDRIHLLIDMFNPKDFHVNVHNVSRTAASNKIWEYLKKRFSTKDLYEWIQPYLLNAYRLANSRNGLAQKNKTYYALRLPVV